MMRPSSPHALPLGESQPPNNCHAVSASLPTWHSVTSWSRREEWIAKQMKSGYPRFFLNDIIQDLSRAVIDRLGHHSFECMIFPSFAAAQRLLQTLRRVESGACLHHVQFASATDLDARDAYWASFHAVLYPPSISADAMGFWRETGDGISSRHAQFCLERFGKLQAGSPVRNECSPADKSAAVSHHIIKTRIAELLRSEDVLQPSPDRHDVYLYPKGLCAIYSITRALLPSPQGDNPSEVVVYGWPYAETVKAIGRSGWDIVTLYGHGSKAELDQLESSLAAGKRIQVLFCELPSNPQLNSPDLVRIRELADQYSFIVACDETLGTFVNVDVLPFVDIVMTSLTKIFSGKSDVMGGSVVVNPGSRFYDLIHQRLAAQWEDSFFPEDVKLLAENSVDFVERVRYCSDSALNIATILSKHPSVSRIYYPSLLPTKSVYDHYRRPNGGYGFVLSIIFKHPLHAVAFYDSLDVCKGANLGANFTLSIPYSQLAHFHNMDFAEANGVPRHIVRISVGIDDGQKLEARVVAALKAVESTDVKAQENDEDLMRMLNLIKS